METTDSFRELFGPSRGTGGAQALCGPSPGAAERELARLRTLIDDGQPEEALAALHLINTHPTAHTAARAANPATELLEALSAHALGRLDGRETVRDIARNLLHTVGLRRPRARTSSPTAYLASTGLSCI